MDIFTTSRKVVSALQNKDCAEALRWCVDNRKRLAKINSSLEFKLRVQQFVELKRAQRVSDAIAHMRKYVAPLASVSNSNAPSAPDCSPAGATARAGGGGGADHESGSLSKFEDLQRVIALLAFPVDTQCEPYAQMYHEERWTALIEHFKRDNYALHGLTSEAQLCILIKAGLSALKTQFCATPNNASNNSSNSSAAAAEQPMDMDHGRPATPHHQERQHQDEREKKEQEQKRRKRKSSQHYNVNCPTCNAPFNALSARLPFTNHAHSTLVCSVTNAVMDEHNLPMALPNGNVYSERALELLAAAAADNNNSNGFVTDPRTGEQFAFPEAVKKVFIM